MLSGPPDSSSIVSRRPISFRTLRHCRETVSRPLKGDRKGQYSIRVNDQWRICFEWPDDSPGPTNVEIVDYH